MSDCCSPKLTTTKHQKLSCPLCHVKCKLVTKKTVLLHLVFPLNLDTPSENFYHCSNSECDTIYFLENGTSYNISQVRDKLEIQQGWLCYCFDISKQQYQHALDTGTASEIKDFVIKQTQSHLCACDIRNPSGKCCLAEFKKMENNL
ncbi:hypothetical protein MNBD_GAMMA22-939 [hydrothermal vent metagenome]|uniref:CopZ zinc binding domain-containing protein n=1 Tax=hydrothermal vent metagenome TaxID=652676 RepID=A0A3B1ALY9_9ZZZZ